MVDAAKVVEHPVLGDEPYFLIQLTGSESAEVETFDTQITVNKLKFEEIQNILLQILQGS
jgi:hypothetical protein